MPFHLLESGRHAFVEHLSLPVEEACPDSLRQVEACGQYPGEIRAGSNANGVFGGHPVRQGPPPQLSQRGLTEEEGGGNAGAVLE